jgi:hypothetical protein
MLAINKDLRHLAHAFWQIVKQRRVGLNVNLNIPNVFSPQDHLGCYAIRTFFLGVN